MIRSLRRRHHWLVAVVALVTGLVFAAALILRERPLSAGSRQPPAERR